MTLTMQAGGHLGLGSFEGLMFFVDLHVPAKDTFFKFRRNPSIAKRVKFRESDLEMEVKDIDDLVNVRRPCDFCQLENSG